LLFRCPVSATATFWQALIERAHTEPCSRRVSRGLNQFATDELPSIPDSHMRILTPDLLEN
jgi:hypothetical protein